MGERLRGRNAVVTGAGRGIGRAVALALAEEGASIVVCDLGATTDGKGADRSPADAVVEECQKLGVRAVPHYGDVADFKAAMDMIKACVENFGRIDILCNIAGIFTLSRIFDMSEEEWDRVIAVHLKGTFNLTRHATPLMKQQRYGRIINCSSVEYTGTIPIIGNANYVAAKGGITSLTYAVAREMGTYGVTCNAFTPRAMTRLVSDWEREGIKGGFVPQELRDGDAMKEHADPEYFASFIAYLASDAAADVNGCIFYCSPAGLGIWNRPEIVRHVVRDWKEHGRWRFAEIEKLVPEKLLGRLY